VASVSGQTIRVLLISTSESTHDEVAGIFSQRSRDYHLYWVAQPEVAQARAQDLVPHVIIVDDEVEGSTSVSLIANLTKRFPTAALVALVSPGSVSKANQAVLAGARGFLVKPLQADELMATMRNVLAQGQIASSTSTTTKDTAGKIVAVCAPKGGTGRTTTVINIGYWLMQLTKSPVVLLDTDYAAPAIDVALNLQSERSLIDLLPRINRLDKELIESVLETHSSGLKMLLAPSPSLWDQEISLPHVQQILGQMQRIFGWVVIDMGLQLSEMSFAFLDSADQILVTVLPEMVGLRNATWMIDQMRSRGYPDERVWLVINRSTLRGGISREDIEQHLHLNVKYTVPDDQNLATYAINRGIPYSISHPKSAVAKAIRGLAELIVSNSQSPVTEPELREKTPAKKPRFALPRLRGSQAAD
jgi:pilus assembly protein CpaE